MIVSNYLIATRLPKNRVFLLVVRYAWIISSVSKPKAEYCLIYRASSRLSDMENLAILSDNDANSGWSGTQIQYRILSIVLYANILIRHHKLRYIRNFLYSWFFREYASWKDIERAVLFYKLFTRNIKILTSICCWYIPLMQRNDKISYVLY